MLPFELALADDVHLALRQAPCVSSAHAKEASASADGLCTASTVWDAGVVLAAHVFSRSRPREPPGASSAPCRRCLDLGSGTGIVGLAAAASGAFARVVLTDLPSVVPLLRENAETNSAALAGVEVVALALPWDDVAALRECLRRFGPLDLIVGGDLLYRTQVVGPLLTALTALASEQTTVLLGASLAHSPETLQLFEQRAAAAGFCVERLGASEQLVEFASPEVRLLRLRLTRASGLTGARRRREPG